MSDFELHGPPAGGKRHGADTPFARSSPLAADPLDPQLLADYARVCARFGALPFRDFVRMWSEADALMADAARLGFEPEDVPGLLIPD